MLKLAGVAGFLGAAALILCAQLAQADAAYKVVSEDVQGGARSLAVRLTGRQTDVDLKAMAERLHDASAAGKPPVATVAFYLPAMDLDGAPWATAVVKGGVHVAIIGLRLDEEEAFRAAASGDRRNVSGVWLTSPPALPGMLTIYRDQSRQTFAEWRLRNGHVTRDELSESAGSRGRKYEIAGAGGGYYLALWNGALELGDRSNVIAVAERLNVEQRPAPASAANSAGAPAAATASDDAATAAAKFSGVKRTAVPANRKTLSPPVVADAIQAAMGRY